MTTTYADVATEQLAATDTTLFTLPGTADSGHLIYATVANVSTVAVDITVNAVKTGDTAATTNIYLEAQTIPSGRSVVLSQLLNVVLKPGDFISAKASAAASLNFKMGIKEISS